LYKRITNEDNNKKKIEILKCNPPPIPDLSNDIDNAMFRMLMAHLGFINPLNANRLFVIKHLNSSENINYNELFGELDSCSERTNFDVGVFYMGRYENLSEMLSSNGSREYNEFIDNLGWQVDLNEHLGYLGNLHPDICGPVSRYYADSDVEIMFHVATLMPNIDNNVHKLNYVMNDPILIVWNEYYNENRPQLLKTKAKAIIQITPLPSELFRINIFSEDLILGPLLNNCVVTKLALTTFVVETIIDFVTYNIHSFPLERRGVIITRILEKYGRETKLNDLYSSLFKYENF